ncbi:hypothetical protein [Lignipirellula cremea]|uniref:hypothetical protein n=1 Tax=Lignipirellula cremea TaxID=2528010 RepID=UPI0011A165F2|nr:hypothetical protein [Lignipirellula cremea]
MPQTFNSKFKLSDSSFLLLAGNRPPKKQQRVSHRHLDAVASPQRQNKPSPLVGYGAKTSKTP